MSRTSSNLLTTYLGRDKWQAIVDSQKLNAQQVLIGKKKEALMIKEALTAFCDEAKNDHADVAELLIAAGANLNVTDTLGQTPLGCARAAGRVDVVWLLETASRNGPEGK